MLVCTLTVSTEGTRLTQAFIFIYYLSMNETYCVAMKICLQTLPAANLQCLVPACF